VYFNEYTKACHQDTQTQLNFLSTAFANSQADWKFLQLHHGFMSSAQNYTELQPIMDIVRAHRGVVLNGHDHCLAHYQYNDTNFILSGAAGYPQSGDCNNGVALGPYAKFLGANANAGELFSFRFPFTLSHGPSPDSPGADDDVSGKRLRDHGSEQGQHQRGVLYA
jgi:hypothetical protein